MIQCIHAKIFGVIYLNVKTKIKLLICIEVLIIVACMLLSGTAMQWMVNIYGSTATATTLAAATVLAAGAIIVLLLIYITRKVLKLSCSSEEESGAITSNPQSETDGKKQCDGAESESPAKEAAAFDNAQPEADTADQPEAEIAAEVLNETPSETDN